MLNIHSMKILNAGNINATMQIVMQYAKQGSQTAWAKANHGSHIELWRKLRQTIKYTPDPKGKELIRTVDETLKAKQADCEDFSALISAILLVQKICHFFRIYDYGRGYEHIAVVLGDGTVIDPVNDVYNVEPEYLAKRDFYHDAKNKNLMVASNYSLSGLTAFHSKENVLKGSQQEINKRIEYRLDEAHRYSKEDIDLMYENYEGDGGQGSKGASGSGVLYEFYTPNYVCELMHELALHHGYDGGNILDPACATGRLITPFKEYGNVVGFETNPYSAKIAELKHEGMTVYNDYFETAFLQKPRFTARLGKKGELETWLQQYPFSLVIANPPYGIYKNTYSSYFPFEKKLAQTEMVFMYWSLKMLKRGGLMVFITAQNFMRTGDKYQFGKGVVDGMATLVDAYQLPSLFKFSQVPTNIIILRKK